MQDSGLSLFVSSFILVIGILIIIIGESSQASTPSTDDSPSCPGTSEDPSPSVTPSSAGRSKARRKRNNRLTPPPLSSSKDLADVRSEMRAQNDKLRDELRTQNDKLTQLSDELRAHDNSLKFLFQTTMVPLYTSLLVKGVAAYIFWRGPGRYQNVELSVRQLTFLEQFLRTTPRHDILRRALQIVQDHPIPPHGAQRFDTGSLTLRYPEILNCAPLSGNSPAQQIISRSFVQTLDNQWQDVVNARDQTAHQASARQLADFLNIILTHRQGETYWIPTDQFLLLQKYYRVLFGFNYDTITQQPEPAQNQTLTNSGSWDTLVGIDDEEKADDDDEEWEGGS